MTELDEIKQLLQGLTVAQRREVFGVLRKEFPIHSIEQDLNADAEVILEAIHRASDLTLRGIRGVIAEAAFAMDVVGVLDGWADQTPPGDAAYDFSLIDRVGPVNVQVKLQRRRRHEPMFSEEAPRWACLPAGLYVVETQRTRGGKTSDGEDSRPYRFGEFDILAVSLHPSTNDWSRFLYTVADWLVPHPQNETWIQKYQAVPLEPNEYWTDDFPLCVKWFRSGNRRVLPTTRLSE